MTDGFVKFPRTPHLAWLGDTPPRGDKLLTPREAAALLKRPVVVEEKVDGAGIGLLVGSTGGLLVQSRGSYLERTTLGQFRPLWPWLASRESSLRDALGTNLVVYGEWCYARHTVPYDALSDWFLAFDVYDRSAKRFWSAARRDGFVTELGLSHVPQIATGRFDRPGLERLLGRSRVGSAPTEGLYLRWAEGPWLVARAKLVRASWVPLDEQHWSARPLVANRRIADKAPSVRTGRA
jgi:hypothetical protein